MNRAQLLGMRALADRMTRRTLNLECVATLPNGAGFLEVRGYRDSSEQWNGFPVVYVSGDAVRELMEAGLIGTLVFASPVQALARFTAEWTIESEFTPEQFITVEIS